MCKVGWTDRSIDLHTSYVLILADVFLSFFWWWTPSRSDPYVIVKVGDLQRRPIADRQSPIVEGRDEKFEQNTLW